jgi:dUTP pyrophosphatase
MLKLKIKKTHPDAKIPSYANVGDACFDLTAVSAIVNYKYVEYDTGLAFEIPDGYVGLIYPRSSVTNKDMMLKNCVGIIDSSFRGNVTFRYHMIKEPMNNDSMAGDYRSHIHPDIYEVGDRIGQMMLLPVPTIDFEEVDELTESIRGTGGYGSSGK